MYFEEFLNRTEHYYHAQPYSFKRYVLKLMLTCKGSYNAFKIAHYALEQFPKFSPLCCDNAPEFEGYVS